MGKSTINVHFHSLFACLPEGRASNLGVPFQANPHVIPWMCHKNHRFSGNFPAKCSLRLWHTWFDRPLGFAGKVETLVGRRFSATNLQRPRNHFWIVIVCYSDGYKWGYKWAGHGTSYRLLTGAVPRSDTTRMLYCRWLCPFRIPTAHPMNYPHPMQSQQGFVFWDI